jgi:hypothetical protein
LYPKRYLAATTLLPINPANIGVLHGLRQIGGGGISEDMAANEVIYQVASSTTARHAVIVRLNLLSRLHLSDERAGERWLENSIDIFPTRGGLVQIQCLSSDPELGIAVVAAVADVTRQKVTELLQEQAKLRRDIFMKLVADAELRLSKAQSDHDSAGGNRENENSANDDRRIRNIYAEITAAEVEHIVALKYGTPYDISVLIKGGKIIGLKGMLAKMFQNDHKQSDSIKLNVKNMTNPKEIAENEVERFGYHLSKALEDTTIKKNLIVIQSPYIDMHKQINIFYLMIGIILFMLTLMTEFYQVTAYIDDKLAAE